MPPDATAPARAFTSTLSSAELAVLMSVGARPIRQVMGCSVWQTSESTSGDELDRPMENVRPGRCWRRFATGMYNQARISALARLRAEASACGADLVVGLGITQRRVSEDMFEFRALGTAIAQPATALGQDRRPVLSALSAQEYALLDGSGYTPVGIAAHSVVLYAAGSHATGAVPRHLRRLVEYPEFSAAVTQARSEVMTELTAQAHRDGAQGVVGVSFEREQRSFHHHGRLDVQITVHARATAVAAVEHRTRVQHRDRVTGALLQDRWEWRDPPILPGLTLIQDLSRPAAPDPGVSAVQPR